MKKNILIKKFAFTFALCGIFTISHSANLHAYTKVQIEAMKQNGSSDIDVSTLVPDDATDVTPQDLEKSLTTQVLLDKDSKIIFINTLNNTKDRELFTNELQYLQMKKEKIASLSTSEYNLKKSEIDLLSKNIESCTYRQSSGCINQVTNQASNITDQKEAWNKQLILICQVILGINVVAWLIFFFGTKKVVVKEKNEY